MLSNIGLPGLFLLIFLVINVVALWKLFQRSGSNGAWALLGIIPGFQFFLLWGVAFKRWPGDEDGGTN